MIKKFPVLLATGMIFLAGSCKKTVEEDVPVIPAPTVTALSVTDRKSTRLNSSH